MSIKKQRSRIISLWRKTSYHQALPAVFILTSIFSAWAISRTLAVSSGPGYEATQVAYVEAGAWQSLGGNPAYFEKKAGASATEVQQYGPVAYGTGNRTKYAAEEWEKNQPWCANFVSWAFAVAGYPFTGGKSGGWRYSSTTSLKNYLDDQKNKGLAQKITDPNKVMTGDIFYRSGHMGLITGYDGSKYLTIEGNTYGNGDNRHRVMRQTESTSVTVYRIAPAPNPNAPCDILGEGVAQSNWLKKILMNLTGQAHAAVDVDC